MAENSKIEWCHHTFNHVRGCTKVSAGCANCYAESMSGRNPKTLGVWGPNGTRVVAAEAAWREPLRWNKVAKLAAELYAAVGGDPSRPGRVEWQGRTVRFDGRPRVFCASMADVFEDWTGLMEAADGDVLHVCNECGEWRTMAKMCHGPLAHMPLTMQDVRARLFRLIDQTPNLDWLLLTKRPENIERMMPPYRDTHCDHKRYSCADVGCRGGVRPNVWLGASVENRKAAERIKVLRGIPAAVRFLSVEPLLEDLGTIDLTGIDWVIVGGESGHGARPMHPDWARSLRDQCRAANVAFFFKQWGEYAPRDAGGFFSVSDKTNHTIDELGRLDTKHGGGQLVQVGRVGKKAAGRLLDGREWSEFPAQAAEPAT